MQVVGKFSILKIANKRTFAFSRNDHSNAAARINDLSEDCQFRMIKLLLEHGADKSMRVQGLTPWHLLNKQAPNRDRAKKKLKLNRGESCGTKRAGSEDDSSGSSGQATPTSNSPTEQVLDSQ